jgi:hypothetical protein
MGAEKTTMTEGLGGVDPWLIYVLEPLAILLAGVLGRALGGRVHRADPGAADHLPPVQGALIGLLSLMIAFTLSLSLGRFEARQAAVLHEAVAIGSARDRAALLPAAQGRAAAALLGDYLEARIALGAPGGRPAMRRAEITRSLVLQQALWRQAAAVGPAAPSAASAPFMAALDRIEETHRERLAADYNEVPAPVFVTIYILAIVTFGYLGFVSGARGAHNMASNAVLGVAFATVIVVVDDLDRPHSGLVTVSERSLLDLKGAPK